MAGVAMAGTWAWRRLFITLVDSITKFATSSPVAMTFALGVVGIVAAIVYAVPALMFTQVHVALTRPILRRYLGGKGNGQPSLALDALLRAAQVKAPFDRKEMDTHVDKKRCRMCCMQIPAEAKKCPYCQHWQNTLSCIRFHPAFAVVLVTVPLLLVYLFTGHILNRISPESADFREYANQISISDSKIRFGERKSKPVVFILGKVRNKSDIDWDEAHFQVEFFDPKGNLVDAGQGFK